MNPRVYLVGAGPGDPELLAVRAARLVENADVVFHDDLVSAEILALAPGAELVPVGHRAGGRARDIERLADEMASLARRGKQVIRLKGGDPYLFGRGGEEASALLRAGVSFEMVPGISSALAAPAAAGIPLTDRHLASSVTIVTGHEIDGGGRVSWKRLATGADTLVVLMGSRRLGQLSARLIEAGRPPETPAAVVMAATTPEQRQVIARLDEVADLAVSEGIGAPAVLVVGEVASLAAALGGNILRELAAAV